MIDVGFLLHIYQPPNQFSEVMERIARECYRPLVNLFLSSRARFTLNMNWSLTEKLTDSKYRDILNSLEKSLEKKGVELTGSAAYHSILPLIPDSERQRQIELNLENHRELWGEKYRPRGLFPPEMAYGPEIISSVREAGYEWLIADDIPYGCVHRSIPYNFIPAVDELGVLLRSNLWSNRISMDADPQGKKYRGDHIARWLHDDMAKWFGGKDGYIILAMDGETFGHHIPGYIEEFLIPFVDTVAAMSDMRLSHLSEIYDRFPKVEKEIPPGSWSTNADDFWAGNFFPLWKDPKNQAHYLLWQLTELAVGSFEKLRDKMDRSLNSCTFWWAATRPEESSPITLTGIDMLMEVIRVSDPSNLLKAEAIRHQLEKALNAKAAKTA